MRKTKTLLQSLPSVDTLLKNNSVASLIVRYSRPLVVHAVRAEIALARDAAAAGAAAPGADALAGRVALRVKAIAAPSLKPVINATGVILHTNLGRAVLGEAVLADIAGIVSGYSNIEFDTTTGRRGDRNGHVSALLSFLTGAQDALAVNNNAAGIVLALSTLAKKREVIISRGELIEIGGEFRIPDIMAAAGCRMVEVGTTNRTRIADYEKAITPKTAAIFKAHRSNFSVKGFTEEASLEQCAALARKNRLPFVYDIGSGLIRKPKTLPLGNEPDVASAIARGADLVLFSGDKLLGGPQAGIIAGKKDLVARLAKAPLMRALRVGKLTMAALSSACRSYLDDSALVKNNHTFAMLSKKQEESRRLAAMLQDRLNSRGITARIEDTAGQCGGGTLPELSIPSCAVVLEKKGPKQQDSTKRIFDRLCAAERPVVAVLREGSLVFDMLAVRESDISGLAEAITAACAVEAA
jgi:L-seryl-tRNA(Ser) seleniumtransferase